MLDFLWNRFKDTKQREAIIWKDSSYSYGWLLEQIAQWQDIIEANGIPKGAVASIEADFSPNSVALLLALIDHRCVVVPLTNSVEAKKPEYKAIAQAEVEFYIDPQDQLSISKDSCCANHQLYGMLRESDNPGLVLFSSGSTGESKAAVHDISRLLEKFKMIRRSLRTITFLLYDHIGGVNTLLYTLSNSGCLITVPDRTPDGVFRAIERYRAELLPTSPTFLNLVILSEVWKRHDISSLSIITYGTEPMPESTLKRINEIMPEVRLQQTYGLSELGILRSKSKDSHSLWVKVGGENFETKIVDGVLWIKAGSVMLGYLNAPDPFDDDGWFNSEDQVEVDGEFIRFLGRKSEIINVGGEKVYPIEVESLLQTMAGVADVAVTGERNPITGQIVVARVKITTDEPNAVFRQRMREFCRAKLPVYKIPQKVIIVDQNMHGERFKKMRLTDRP